MDPLAHREALVRVERAGVQFTVFIAHGIGVHAAEVDVVLVLAERETRPTSAKAAIKWVARIGTAGFQRNQPSFADEDAIGISNGPDLSPDLDRKRWNNRQRRLGTP